MNRSVLSALVFAFTVGCGEKLDSASQGEVDRILALSGDVTAGATVFSDTCAGCHGADGASGSSPDITGEVAELGDQGLLELVLFGQGDMPAQDLTEQEAADLLAYLRDTFGG